jgi:thioesterase domain-containing protein
MARELGYAVEIRPSELGVDGCFDAVFRRGLGSKEDNEPGIVRFPGDRGVFRPWETYASNPMRQRLELELVPQLRQWLGEKLPEFMVPSAFVLLDTMPLSPTGKITRQALPAPDWCQLSTGGNTAPRDNLESILVRIWKNVLGIPNIGIDDNFFDLGGHSVLAVRLLAEVEKVIGREVLLSSLFRGSTIASLAALLREGSESAPEPLVTELRVSTPASSPIFAVAVPGARSIGYALLARHFDDGQGFFKLQAPGPIVQGRPLNQTEARALAKQYIAGMRAVHREGPYYLVAMCGGCQIAEQMILQLESQGQTVGLFAIFDTWVLEHAHRRWGWLVFAYQQRLRWMRKASLVEIGRWIRQATAHRIRVWTGNGETSTPWIKAYWPENFQAPRFHAPIVLFKRPKQLYFYVNDPLMGWGARSEGGVEVHEVNADHHEVLREPHVQMISQILAARLIPSVSDDPAPARGASIHVGPATVATSH